jgi:hypothetical protein
MLKPTPAMRRALSTDHTTEWLKNRRQAWNTHQAHLDEDSAARQQAADEVTRQRQQSWSDYHAQEASRAAMRDNYPTALDFAKENRRGQQEAAEQLTQGYRQQVADEESHPQHLAQARQDRGGGSRRSGPVAAITGTSVSVVPADKLFKGWATAWRDELRGPDGKWTKSLSSLSAHSAEVKAGTLRRGDYMLYSSGPGKVTPSKVTSIRHVTSASGKPKLAVTVEDEDGTPRTMTLGTTVKVSRLHHQGELENTKARKLSDDQMDREYARTENAKSGKNLARKQELEAEYDRRGTTDDTTASAPQTPKPSAAAPPASDVKLAELWASGYRATGTSETSEARDFVTELNRLMTGGGTPGDSPGAIQAHEFLALMDRNSPPQNTTLWRGLGLTSDEIPQAGDSMDIPVASFSRSHAVARGFTEAYAPDANIPDSEDDEDEDWLKESGLEETISTNQAFRTSRQPVILEVAAGARAMDIQGLLASSNDAHFRDVGQDEQEMATGGRFKVGSVTQKNGITYISLTQQQFAAKAAGVLPSWFPPGFAAAPGLVASLAVSANRRKLTRQAS